MVRKTFLLPRASAAAGLLLFAYAGCVPDLDVLSSEAGGSSGSGGASAGKGGGSDTGGTDAAGNTSTTAGTNAGEPGGGTAGTGVVPVGGEGGGSDGPITCEKGFTLCPDMSECTNLQIGDPDGGGVINCGECGITCGLDNASRATCDKGVCEPTCRTGFGDCNADAANDGCERAITTIENCGACDYACSLKGATATECVSGGCAPTCGPRYADCNSTAALAADDGCEFYLDTLTECTKGCTASRVACGPTQVCNSGNCVAPQGLAVLSVPLDQYTVDDPGTRFADTYSPLVDLEGTTMTVRVYAPGATGGNLLVYLSDSNSTAGSGAGSVPLTTLNNKWVDITFPIASTPATTPPFNAKAVKQVNIELHAGTGPWTNPTVVYVDSVRTSNLAVNHTWDATAGAPNPAAPMTMSSLLKIEGSSLTWSDTVP